MPAVTLNKKVFEKLVGKKLSDKFLSERIPMIGTDLGKITQDNIEVEVFPNRPDMLSEQGFARAFRSFIGLKKGLQTYTIKKSSYKVIIDPSVKNVRPYTACAVVKGIMFDDEKIREVIQIQEKLHVTYGRNRRKVAIGIYPFEKIRTPIKYLAKRPEEIRFKPLESPRVMNGRQILSQHGTGREYAHLLEGFSKFPVFIDANKKVLSMPPIINSDDVGKITESTRDVFIECSGFDFNVLSKCLNMIVTALADMGGTIYSMQLNYGSKKIVTPNLEPEKMKIDINYINKILGLSLKEPEIKKYLLMMGFGYKNKTVLIPAYRADILHQIDLAEDIAIAYGYENFKHEIPNVSTIAKEDEFEVFKRRIANILVGLGLIEVNTYNLTNEEIHNKKPNSDLKGIEIIDAKNGDFNLLRAWMIPSLLNVLSENKRYEYPQKIFDIGYVFKPDATTETRIAEMQRLCVIVSHAKADYTEIKQVLDFLMSTLNLSYEIEDVDNNTFIPGRVGRVSVKGRKVAFIGEIHPQVLENFNLEMPVAALELNLTDLFGVF